MSDDKNKKKSPLVSGNEETSTDRVGARGTGSSLPKREETSTDLSSSNLGDPLKSEPTSLGETPAPTSPTERSLQAEEKLSDSYGRPLSGTTGNTGSSTGSTGMSSTSSTTGSTSSQYSQGQYGSSSKGQSGHSGQNTGDQAQQKAQEAQRKAQQRAKQAKRGFSKLVDEQPLVVGIVAALVGILFGLVLPHTRREDELMGEASENTIKRAKEVAQKTFETAKETVKEEAQRQGLTPDSLKQEAQDKLHKAQDVVKKTAEEAQKAAQQEAKKKS